MVGHGSLQSDSAEAGNEVGRGEGFAAADGLRAKSENAEICTAQKAT